MSNDDDRSNSSNNGSSNSNGNGNNQMAIFGEENQFEPCKVCGEQSSGWHCGAVTCEACKKFFLRSINGDKSKYICNRNKDCVIVRATRTQCQYCRFQKCQEVGMSSNENLTSPTISELLKGFACKVCNAPASGMHFGAVTCEGCKGFFRRSIKERKPDGYKCLENGNCDISATTRNMCRHCRYKRCVQAKMSPLNSRIGRRSNLFKHNIIEWQSRATKSSLSSHRHLINTNHRKVKSEIRVEASFNVIPRNDDFTKYDVTNQLVLTSTNTYQAAPQPLASNIGHLQSTVVNSHNSSLMNMPFSGGLSMMSLPSSSSSSSSPSMSHQSQASYDMSGMSNESINPASYSNAVNSTSYYTWSTSNYATNGANQTPTIMNTIDNGNNMHNLSNTSSSSNSSNSSFDAKGMMMMNTHHQGYINPNNNSNIKNESIGSSSLSTAMVAKTAATSSTKNIEDSLDVNVRTLITQINQAYKSNLLYIHELIKTDLMQSLRKTCLSMQQQQQTFQPQQQQQQQELDNVSDANVILRLGPFKLAIEHLRFYARKIAEFAEQIPGACNLIFDDKQELIRSSIHPVMLVTLQRNRANCNYFGCEPRQFDMYTQVFPVFARANNFMKQIHDKFDKYKLDEKEYALIASLLIISSANKHLKDLETTKGIREAIGDALRKYMSYRRNEEITCDEIILLLSKLRKLNGVFQDDIAKTYFSIMHTNNSAFNGCGFFHQIYMPHRSECRFTTIY